MRITLFENMRGVPYVPERSATTPTPSGTTRLNTSAPSQSVSRSIR